MRVTFGKNIYNRVKLNSYPRKVDAAPVVLWNLENPIELAAGQTLSKLRSSYRDPNGKSVSISAIDSSMSVSYTANSLRTGAGTDRTSSLTVTPNYGSSEVEYDLANAYTSTIYVTVLTFSGRGVTTFDTASVTFESQSSITNYDIQELTIDFPYVDDATTLFVASNNLDRALLETGTDYLLMEDGSYFKLDDTAGVFDLLVSDEPSYWIESATFTANRDKFNMLAFMCLTAGASIYITETMTGVTGDYVYYINGYDFEILPAGIVKWHPQLVSALKYPRL
jgi:hypothetical protein